MSTANTAFCGIERSDGSRSNCVKWNRPLLLAVSAAVSPAAFNPNSARPVRFEAEINCVQVPKPVEVVPNINQRTPVSPTHLRPTQSTTQHLTIKDHRPRRSSDHNGTNFRRIEAR